MDIGKSYGVEHVCCRVVLVFGVFEMVLIFKTNDHPFIVPSSGNCPFPGGVTFCVCMTYWEHGNNPRKKKDPKKLI
jgi:hypothetical protein